MRVQRASPGATGLAVQRVAALTLAHPDLAWSLRLVGSFRMEHPEDTDDPGTRTYRMTPLSVRVLAAHEVPVAVDEFLRAEPDLSAARARTTLEHLEQQHQGDLLAWAAGRGLVARVALPRTLDRHGLELCLLGDDGVRRVQVPVSTAPDGGTDLARQLGLSVPCTEAPAPCDAHHRDGE